MQVPGCFLQDDNEILKRIQRTGILAPKNNMIGLCLKPTQLTKIILLIFIVLLSHSTHTPLNSSRQQAHHSQAEINRWDRASPGSLHLDPLNPEWCENLTPCGLLVVM
jgi:hypothetical protein